jgi:CubicO group peptidase (beta-lactamase class C family)
MSFAKLAAKLAANLDAVIDRALADQRIVGTHVVVAIDGAVAYARAAGFLDREAGRPMAPRTIFRLASVTKPYVAVAALAAAEAGLLDLDAPVTRYLPAFRPKLRDGRTPVITVRQLMTHTSGLTYDLSGATRPVSGGLDDRPLSMADALAGIASVPLAFEPGTKWEYSVGIDVLGGVLEAVEGKTLPEIVRARVTGPLGLADTGFGVADPDRLAVAYADGRPPKRMGAIETVVGADGGETTFAPGRIFSTACFPSGGAGMAGTVEDFLIFIEALRTGGAPLLGPRFARLVAENGIGALEAREPGRHFSHVASMYADPAKSGSPLSPGSWGWGGVYGHQWRVDKARRMVILSFTNTALEGCNGAFPGDVVKAAVEGVG